MKQLIFFVDGLREQTDEIAVFQAVESIFGSSDIKVNGRASSLSITVGKDFDIDAAVEQLKVTLEELGYMLKLPPSRVDIAETHPTDNPLETRSQKDKRRVPMSAFVASVCAVLIVAILGAYAVATAQFNQKLIDIEQEIWDSNNSEPSDDSDGTNADDLPSVSTSFPELEIFKFLFDQYGIEEVDDEALLESLLKAYADSSGDIYAEYYTAEEFKALRAENQGSMEGVGVSVTNDLVEINGQTHQVMTVINVFNDSPALEAGVRIGDHIYTVTDANGTVFTVDELGYDGALVCVRGVSGTQAEFSVVRFSEQSADPEIIPFSITRASITAETVTSRVFSSDSKIAIVKISQFDLTTPEQFRRNMDTLINQGCTKFIFDVRYNPGGLLPSVKAVLSTLLQEGDIIMSTVYKNETPKTDYVEVIPPSEDVYDECTVSAEDIGKYSAYDFAVLTNEYTASAAELFAANIRDHKLGTLVGEITYGKGCMQTIYNLFYFGLEGGLKLTTAWYAPPCGENYHDVGITPDIAVETDKALIEQYGNIYLVPDEQDPQIRAAIEALNQ